MVIASGLRGNFVIQKLGAHTKDKVITEHVDYLKNLHQVSADQAALVKAAAVDQADKTQRELDTEEYEVELSTEFIFHRALVPVSVPQRQCAVSVLVSASAQSQCQSPSQNSLQSQCPSQYPCQRQSRSCFWLQCQSQCEYESVSVSVSVPVSVSVSVVVSVTVPVYVSFSVPVVFAAPVCGLGLVVSASQFRSRSQFHSGPQAQCLSQCQWHSRCQSRCELVVQPHSRVGLLCAGSAFCGRPGEVTPLARAHIHTYRRWHARVHVNPQKNAIRVADNLKKHHWACKRQNSIIEPLLTALLR